MPVVGIPAAVQTHWAKSEHHSSELSPGAQPVVVPRPK